MGRISERYLYKTTPLCKEEAVVQGSCYRFTVLTERLIRLEYSENGKFEDRATQVVINRDFEVPEFTVTNREDKIIIRTDCMEITYFGGKFTPNSLSAKFAGKNGGIRYEWHFGDNELNLKGTARTLDTVDGECELEDGIMSRAGMAVLDDSNSLIIANDGWIDVRENKSTDIYLFAYRDDYKAALRDFCKLSGNIPMIPRYALGNWWSRFYKYTQEEYCELVKRFEAENIPFSVAVIDMDWHPTKIDAKYGSGWTGFSWNRELFHDHTEFLKFIEEHNMKVTLNLHPAEGIAAHEDAYLNLAKAMGVDYENEETVEFDIANPKFVENYFEKVLHPLEKEGVAFWWMDWQQGNKTKIAGLDPLWMLNHYHYIDMQSKNARPMIFLRYSGPGSQRYPIGFSGDTYATWESLDFQPYFTANASNICYGWWSHDIGGHMFGYRDDEMVTRWVQFGVFSPIMRLHSMCNDFQSKEPWKYNEISRAVMCDFLRLRHKLIPYLYTMNYRAYNECEPLISPIYYECNKEEAYSVNRNEYFFGSQMIVIPITRKSDSLTTMGNTEAYLPEGKWYDFFNGRCYSGNHTYKMYRNISEIPVMVKSGGIIPLDGGAPKNGAKNPKHLEIHVFPGEDNTFTMYEDDGNTMSYKDGVCVKTKFDLKNKEDLQFVINRPAGDKELMIKDREYTVVLRNIKDTDSIKVTEDGAEKSFYKYCRNKSVYINVKAVNGEVVINADCKTAENGTKEDIFNILLKAQCENNIKEVIYNKLTSSETPTEFIGEITALDIDKNLFNAIVEIIVAGEESFTN